MNKDELIKLFEDLKKAHELPNDNTGEYNLGYVDAMRMAINKVKKLTLAEVVSTCCEPVGEGFYLGTSCPKCKQPFRQNLK